MSKLLAFLHSPTVVQLIGIAGTLGANVVIPNSPAVSIAVAALAGVTQATHAYTTVRVQQSITAADFGKAAK